MALFGLFSKKKKESLDKGLEKTKESVFKKLSRAIVGKSKVDEEVLDNLEEVLISSDVGVDTTLRVIRRIEERVQRDKYVGVNELNRIGRDDNAGELPGTEVLAHPERRAAARARELRRMTMFLCIFIKLVLMQIPEVTGQ